MSSLFFSTIEVTRQAFYRTANTFAIVNLKPIVPGHVLVVPNRNVERLTDLTPTEVGSLFASVQTVGRVVEKAYKADGLTIACQDGKAAGQSVPHVHIHVLPRKTAGDRFEGRNDAIYPALEDAEAELHQDIRSVATDSNQPVTIRMDMPEDRPPRSMEDMIKEAEWLKGWFEREN